MRGKGQRSVVRLTERCSSGALMAAIFFATSGSAEVRPVPLGPATVVAEVAPGTFLVVWARWAVPGSNLEIVGRRVGPDGPVSETFVISDSATAVPYSAAVAGRPGEALVVWQDEVEAGRRILARGFATAACPEKASTLCLGEGRFALTSKWADFDGNTGVGIAHRQTRDTGTFWFFDPNNLELIVKVLDGTALNNHYWTFYGALSNVAYELVVKVLDGRALNGHFWVFYGALSNVEYDLVVTDTSTGLRRGFHNPSRHFGSVADVEAFPSP